MKPPWTELDPSTLQRRLRDGDAVSLVDVRTAPEIVAYRIPGSLWIPLDRLADRFRELSPDDEVVLVCEHGIRSAAACRFLHARGYGRLYNLTGGMSAWAGPIESGPPLAGTPLPAPPWAPPGTAD